MEMLCVLLLIFATFATVAGDYPCVCNYNVEAAVHLLPDDNSEALGYMYEFDCKPAGVGQGNSNYLEIMFEGKIGYIKQGADVQSQTCPGLIPTTDQVTTTTLQTTTTPPPTTITTATPKPTTTTTTTPRPTTTTPLPTTTTTTTTPQPKTSTTTTTTTNPTTTTAIPTTSTTATPRPTTTTPIPTTTTTSTSTPKPTTTTTTATTSKPTTTTSTTTTTTPIPTTTQTTTTSTTTPRTTTTTTIRTTTERTTPPSTEGTTIPSTPPSSVPEGHIELCPDHVKGDLSIFGGYLGQFGDYCFELVNVSTQWHNGQRHCTVAGGGYLAHVTNKAEQDFFVRFLEKHHYVESVWLGLTDSEKETATTEGHWSWISGVPVTYTNFGRDYNGHGDLTHKLNDCVIMKQGGEWTDVPCGVPLIVGTGFGESHPFICQFNVTSKPPNIFHIFTDVLVG